jgi:hypothetical protein
MKQSPEITPCRWPKINLREIEEEALEEGRRWTQRRIEEKLREKTAAFSPDGRKNPSADTAPETDR